MKIMSTILAATLCMATFTASASDRIDLSKVRINPKPHPVHFTNNCRYPIKLAMRYRDVNGNWITGGWWRFAGKERAYLKRSSTGRRVYTYNGVVYYYAETTRGRKVQWSGNEKKRLGSTVLKMRRKEPEKNKKGVYVLKIKCDP
jgi:uncharacterized membrane protein